MYIQPLSRAPSGPRVDCAHPTHTSAAELRRSLHAAAVAIARFRGLPHRDEPGPRKRDIQSTNVTIGAVVGVLLGVFIVATVYFCVRYHRSIRFSDTQQRSRHRRSGGSSRGSKTSSSGSSAPAPAPAPAPPPPPPPAAAG